MLKPNRREDPYGQNIKFYFNAVAERGGVASFAAPGATTGYPGDIGNQAQYSADPTTAKPVGILLYDVLSYDTNRQHENWAKSGFQARVGQKVVLLAKGEVHTNMIPTGLGTAIAAGQSAYVAANGLISNVAASSTVNTVTYNAPRVGTWMSAADSDGYAVLRIEIQ